MLVRQIHDPKLAQYAYLIGCPAAGEAIVTGDFVFVGGVVPGARAIHVEVTGGPTPQWLEKARADDRG